MPFLDESGRAPAEIAQKGHVSALRRALIAFANFVSPCRHPRISLPLMDRQTCLDCGATRLYCFTTDFEHAQAGIFIGRWEKATSSRQQDGRRMLQKASRMAAANAACRPQGGMSLDRFHALLGTDEEARQAYLAHLSEAIASERATLKRFQTAAPAVHPVAIFRTCTTCHKDLDAFGLCPACDYLGLAPATQAVQL